MSRVPPVEEIVANSLCHGCGTCVAACPVQAIRMRETPSGFLVPDVSAECDGCGVCGAVCPGADVSSLVADLQSKGVDPFYGPVLGAYVVHASDPELRANGQSGGAVTALLRCLLSTGASDGAVVTGPVDVSRRARSYVALSPDELTRSQGSKYCPNALNAIVASEKFRRLDRPAIVGLPCHMQGLLRLQRRGAVNRDALLLGLFCAGVYSFQKIDFLVKDSLREPNNLAEFRFRDKSLGGWPGDVGVTTQSHGTIRISSRKRALAKSAFLHPRCLVCFDQMAVFSDIAFGDPWGIGNRKEGETVVLVRTEKGRCAFEKAVESGAVDAVATEAQKVFVGQTVDSRHKKNWSASLAVWSLLGKKTPRDGIEPEGLKWKDAARRRKFKKKMEYGFDFFFSPDSDSACSFSRQRLIQDYVVYLLRSPFRLILHLFRKMWTGR
jgi:coenzyme F420 hydrogenase subunit beta